MDSVEDAAQEKKRKAFVAAYTELVNTAAAIMTIKEAIGTLERRALALGKNVVALADELGILL